jgi:hypothetical protein
VKTSSTTTLVAETSSLSDEERSARRQRLAGRLFAPDGIDRDTLERIEQLTNTVQ